MREGWLSETVGYIVTDCTVNYIPLTVNLQLCIEFHHYPFILLEIKMDEAKEW